MLLHSGAAFHGHEYSPPSPKRVLGDSSSSQDNHTSRRIPYTRSSYSTPIITNATIYENPLPILSPRPSSEKTPKRFEPTVRFAEPDLDTMSEDGKSAYSEGSVVTASSSRRQKRLSRTSTAFHLALPPPTLTQKQRLLDIRPKLLLQLQRLSADSRPMPEIDVLPSTVVAPRLAKRFPRMFRGKGALGVNDVMVVKSEEYSIQDDNVEGSDSEEESLANRDLLAVICQMRPDATGVPGKAEIVLSDGSIWMAIPSSVNVYEFASVDETGKQRMARWIRRRGTDTAEPKFGFSIISPNSRRHPFLATITQSTLDIPDTYTSLSSSAGKYPPTSPTMRSETSSDEVPDRSICTIDEPTKRLIQVTGIWLALRQGWSPYFKYNDAQAASRLRSVSLTPSASRPGNANTPESTNSPLCALSNKMRKTSNNTPKRSVSTGTAFMQRENARRISNAPSAPPSTVASDSEMDTFVPEKAVILTKKLIAENYPTPTGSLTLPGSGTTTPETPTRPSRRHHLSLQVPPREVQSVAVDQSKRHSMVDMKSNDVVQKDAVPKEKVGGWKRITNIFRKRSRS